MAEIRLTKLSEKLLTTGLLMLIITGILLYKHHLTSETSQLNKIPEVQNKGFPVEYLPASNTSNKKLIYLFSDLDCEQCTKSHFNLIRGLCERYPDIYLQNTSIVGIGESFSIAKYNKYKILFRLQYPILSMNKNIFSLDLIL